MSFILLIVIGILLGWWIIPQPNWVQSLYNKLLGKKSQDLDWSTPGYGPGKELPKGVHVTVKDDHGRDVNKDGVKQIDPWTGKKRW